MFLHIGVPSTLFDLFLPLVNYFSRNNTNGKNMEGCRIPETNCTCVLLVLDINSYRYPYLGLVIDEPDTLVRYGENDGVEGAPPSTTTTLQPHLLQLH